MSSSHGRQQARVPSQTAWPACASARLDRAPLIGRWSVVRRRSIVRNAQDDWRRNKQHLTKCALLGMIAGLVTTTSYLQEVLPALGIIVRPHAERRVVERLHLAGRHVSASGHSGWDFIVGDDWRIAARVVIALAGTAAIAKASVAVWLLPVAITSVVGVSLWRATLDLGSTEQV